MNQQTKYNFQSNQKSTMHEIFHALGSDHEHWRSDKGSVFQVYRNNVKRGKEFVNWEDVYILEHIQSYITW